MLISRRSVYIADKRDSRNEYIFLPSERVKIIACYIIQSKSPVYVEQLMEACLVSRNTIFGDIQILIRQLHEYNVELTYAPKTGYKISGDVIHVRALYFLFFDSLRILLEHGQFVQFGGTVADNERLNRRAELYRAQA